MKFPIAYGAFAIAPFLLGILLRYNDVSTTPFTLRWESSQSLSALDAILLRGYFAGYDKSFDSPIATVALALLVALGVLSLGFRRNKKGALFLAVVALLVILTTGTTGLAGPLLSQAFVALPPLGLYRELYDLVGFLVIAYTFGAAATMKIHPAFVIIGGACAIILGSIWIRFPPSTFWVDLNTIPTRSVSVQRYATLPAFQPLAFRHRGSGINPNFEAKDIGGSPINTSQSSYPETPALGAYALSADPSKLIALGTSEIICQSGFSEASPSGLASNPFISRQRFANCKGQSKELRGNPIFALLGLPKVCSICADAGSGDVFAGDVTSELSRENVRGGISNFDRLKVPRVESDPRLGWVDARLMYAEFPDIGQPFGGVLTASETPLDIGGAKSLLLDVRGFLRSTTGERVTRATKGLRWVNISSQIKSVICVGICAIALKSSSLQKNEVPPALHGVPTPAKELGPWIFAVSVPNGGIKVLQFLSSYDRWWLASDGRSSFAHFRTDATFNAWILPARRRPTSIYIVNLVAAGQFVLEIVAYMLFVYAMVKCYLPTSLTKNRRPAA